MKRHLRLVLALAITVIAGVAVTATLLINHAGGDGAGEYTDEQLISELDSAFKGGQSADSASELFEVLLNRRGSIDRGLVIAAITDDGLAPEIRGLLMDILAGDPGSTRLPDDMRQLLLDE
ncbi:MAG: hypothetical protein LBK28_00380, partial [Propionibacteriaceae bacterium]|nr:hypothetical protein [Propionibacteriaceae bacterium]